MEVARLHLAVETAATRAPSPPAWAPRPHGQWGGRSRRRVTLRLSLPRIHSSDRLQVHGQAGAMQSGATGW